MPPLSFSSAFGGSPSNGSAASNVGSDSVITVGGKGPDVYDIYDVILQYGLAGGVDYDPPSALGLRSFSGRLTIVEGLVKRSISAAFPSPQLSQPYPSDIGNVVFDMLIHDFRRPWRFSFSKDSTFGALRTKSGLGLSIIAINPVAYNAGGAAVNVFNSMLHVTARKVSDNSVIQLGPYHTAE